MWTKIREKENSLWANMKKERKKNKEKRKGRNRVKKRQERGLKW